MYSTQPDQICYMPLPGRDDADVWLRKNITAPEDGAEDANWMADEVYFRTALSRAEVESNFDTLFERGGLLTAQDDRIAALEAELTSTQLALCELYEALEV